MITWSELGGNKDVNTLAEYVYSKCNLEKLAVVVHVLLTTQNLVIPRCYFAEDGIELCKDLQRSCTAIVFLMKPFV